MPALAMACAALVLSFGATTFIERNLEVHGGVAGTDAGQGDEPVPRAETTALGRHDYQRDIQGRNIFDSSDLRTELRERYPADAFQLRDAVLLATVVADRVDQSSALIATGAGEELIVRGYGQGDWLVQELRITRIGQGQVTITAPSGDHRQLVMGSQRAEL